MDFSDRSKGSWLLAMYLIPGCIGRGVRLGSESSSGGAGGGAGAGVWAQARAQAREIWKSGTQKSGNLRSKKIQKIQILKIKIRSAQNVGKVWISRKKILLTPFGPIWAHFLRGPKNRCQPIFPWWAHGPLLLSTRGGAIGSQRRVDLVEEAWELLVA